MQGTKVALGLAPFDSILRRLESDSAAVWGSRPVVLEPIAVTKRPSSSVLRVRVRSPERTFGAFIKIYEPVGEIGAQRHQLAADYRAAQNAHAHMSERGLGVAKPIACFPESLAIVTEEAPGETLAALLRRELRWSVSADGVRKLTAIFERIGAWLWAFQARSRRPGALSLDGIREYLDDRLQLLVAMRAAGFDADRRNAALRQFDSLAERVPPSHRVLVQVHGDFCPENVLVDGERITVIDFAAERGSALHDLTHLHCYMGTLYSKPWMSRATIDSLQQALLRGYDRSLAPAEPLFQLLVMQHTVCQIVVQQTAGWGPLRLAYNRFLWSRHFRSIGASS